MESFLLKAFLEEMNWEMIIILDAIEDLVDWLLEQNRKLFFPFH